MNEFEKGVPFDPGFSQHYAEIAPFYDIYTLELSKLKAVHQRKFKLNILESNLVNLINRLAGFYLGCMLWAGYLSYTFKDNSRNVIDNPSFIKDSAQEIPDNFVQDIDDEKKLIDKLNKDYNFYLKRPLNINKNVLIVLQAYREFVILNNNFVNLTETSKIKLPESFIDFTNFGDIKLDSVKTKIKDVVKSGKLEDLLDLIQISK